MIRRIRNPVTGTAYEYRTRSSKAGTKPPPRGLWSRKYSPPNNTIEDKNEN